MNKMVVNQKVYKQVRNRHIFIWLLITLKFIFFTSITGSIISKLIWYLTLLFNFAFAYYILLIYLWPNIIVSAKKKLIYFLLFVLLGSFFISIYYCQIELLIPSLGGRLIWTGKAISFQLKQFCINFSYVVFASLGSYFNWNGINQVEKDLYIEKRKVEIEFSLLKNQFHSHFTFNFFNFCYNKIRKFSDKLADRVEDFSEMLRYSLKKLDEKVSLNEEIEYLEKWISFREYLIDRLSVELNCTLKGNTPRIFPKILTILVEDSLKDAILNDPKSPVRISISSTNNEIRLEIINRKNNNFHENSTQYTKNIEQILRLFYPEKHEVNVLTIDEKWLYEIIFRE